MKKVKILFWNWNHPNSQIAYEEILKRDFIKNNIKYDINFKRYTDSPISKNRINLERIPITHKIKQMNINRRLSKYDIILTCSMLVDFNYAYGTIIDFLENYNKPRNQTVIDLLHGPIIKTPATFLEANCSKIDYFISHMPFTTKRLKTLGYRDDQIKEFGTTKYEYLERKSRKEIDIKYYLKVLGVPENATFTLYSPTWTRNANPSQDLNNLLEDLKTDHLVVSPHHHLKTLGTMRWVYDKKYEDRLSIINQDWISSGDLLYHATYGVSDYSSTLFDFYQVLGEKFTYRYISSDNILSSRYGSGKQPWGSLEINKEFVYGDDYKYFNVDSKKLIADFIEDIIKKKLNIDFNKS